MFLMLAFYGCEVSDQADEDDLNLVTCASSEDCDECVIVNKKLFEETDTQNYVINELNLTGNCLELTFSSSGCSGVSWETDLVDLGGIAESIPPQRELKLRLINQELCLAWITKTVSFNVAPLQVDGGKVLLDLEGWEEGIFYIY